MAGFFGNGYVLEVDANDNSTFTTVGEVLSINPPGKSYDMVEFTAIGDAVKQFKPSPTQNAEEWEFTVLMDRTQAEQPEVDGIIGDSTFHSWRITHPWASSNQDDFEACCHSKEIGEVTNDGRVEVTYRLTNNTDVTTT